MNNLATLALATCALSPTLATAQVGVSIGINQPGVYGRIDIGAMAPPPVVYARPVVYAPPRVAVVQPVYLYVPPGHRQHWGRYCGRYNACGRPVYFVRESWVHERYGHEGGHGYGNGTGYGHPGRGH